MLVGRSVLTILCFALVSAAHAQNQPIANRSVAIDQPGAPTGPGAASATGGARPPSPRRENPTTSIQEFVRIEGYSRSTLRGIGIVTGLPGTGDSGKELLLARPLAQVYANNGNPLPDLKDLGAARSAAMVTISCEIPEGGGRIGDTFDVFVQVSHSAKSLKGGTLILSPLMGPKPGDPAYAIASGPILLEEADIPTSGRIRVGAQLVRDIRARPMGDVFNLVVKPYFRSYATTRTIASEINGISADLESAAEVDPIAIAIDDMTVRVTIPEHERANAPNFLANIMTKRFSPSLIDLPAMVVVNERTGSIVVTGDVEISAVTVGNDKLVVTTTTPPPVPTAQDPQIKRDNWAQFGTNVSSGERARIQDLLEAFKGLNVPVREQIQVLAQIAQTGRLHARFVRE